VINQEETVLEMLRRGPITFMMLPDVGNLRAVIAGLRKRGHNIAGARGSHYDGKRLRSMAEYRLLPPKQA
jgi:hypothetical protein